MSDLQFIILFLCWSRTSRTTVAVNLAAGGHHFACVSNKCNTCNVQCTLWLTGSHRITVCSFTCWIRNAISRRDCCRLHCMITAVRIGFRISTHVGRHSLDECKDCRTMDSTFTVHHENNKIGDDAKRNGLEMFIIDRDCALDHKAGES